MLKKYYQGWFNLVDKASTLKGIEGLTGRESAVVHQYSNFLFESIEKSDIKRSFKMILLEAFIELDGLRVPPSVSVLSEKSWHVLYRHSELYNHDLQSREKRLKADDSAWRSYWRRNPVKHSTGKDDYFEVQNDKLCCTEKIDPSQVEVLYQLMQELVDYRLARYRVKKKLTQINTFNSETT